MRLLVYTTFLVAISSPLLAQEPEEQPDWNFKSKDARAAIRQYGAAIGDLNAKGEAALKKLEDGYKKRVKEQRLELLVEFEKALAEATKSGDLDEAIKIRNAIKALHGGAEPPGVPGEMEFSGKPKESPNEWMKHLLGRWQLGKVAGGTVRWDFKRDGTVIDEKQRIVGRWEKKDTRIIIRWPNPLHWATLNFPLDQKIVIGDDGHRGPDFWRAIKIK